MAALFNTRKLSGAYTARSVVNISHGARTNDGFLRFRTTIEFGKEGRFTRAAEVQVAGLHINEIYDSMQPYVSEILEIIGYLEDFQDFIHLPEKNPQHEDAALGTIFNRVLCTEHPVMFHAVRQAKGTSLKIFTEGAHDLSIDMEAKSSGNSVYFLGRKINDMIEHFRNHLKQIDGVPVDQLMAVGAAA